MRLRYLSRRALPRFGCWGARRSFSLAIVSFFIVNGWLGSVCLAQSASDDSNVIRGVVINSVTDEPIDRALVSSPDHRFATLTNSEGRFEFALTKSSASDNDSDSNFERGPVHHVSNRPTSLSARKPGFLSDPNQQGNTLRNNQLKDLTIALTPEAVIAGTIALPTSEAPDSITLQLFRRQIQEGHARWVPAGGSRSLSDGSFRFSDLTAGTYKLLTTELLDTDPVTSDPHADPFAPDAHEPRFGYPPVYYQNASDFESAASIRLAAGETQTVNLSLVKQTYYRVKVPVIASAIDEGPLGVTVYAGHKGPGFSLGYNLAHHAVEGLLPNGTYTVEVTSLRPNGASGSTTITIKGEPIGGPSMALAPNGLIPVNVKEEFTSTDHTGTLTVSHNGQTAVLNGPRRYLNVTLDPADDFGSGRDLQLRNPTGPQDESLVIEGAPAGRYWVRIHSSRGYPASIRSGNLDLQHQPLVVGAGGTAPPIEITMRDDTASISGTVDGITAQTKAPGSASPGPGSSSGSSPGPGSAPGPPGPTQSRARVYCIPLADSSGQFSEIWVHSDGSFESPELPPGAYRVLAFDQAQKDIEYRNPEAMQAYDSKGSVVRLAGGQKERVTLQLISASAASNEQ